MLFVKKLAYMALDTRIEREDSGITGGRRGEELFEWGGSLQRELRGMPWSARSAETNVSARGCSLRRLSFSTELASQTIQLQKLIGKRRMAFG